MDELVKIVMERTGLSEELARAAVTAVVGFMKERLPAQLAGPLDSVLSGGSAGSSLESEGASLLGNLFHKEG